MDCDTFVMEPGSVLYMPKGIVHYAETRGEDMSVHMTLGLLQDSHTWQDVLSYACLQAESKDCKQLDQAFKSMFAQGQGVAWRDTIPFWRNDANYTITNEHVSDEFLELAVAHVQALLVESRQSGLIQKMKTDSRDNLDSYMPAQKRAMLVEQLFASLEDEATIKSVVKMIADDDAEGDEADANGLARLKRLRRSSTYFQSCTGCSCRGCDRDSSCDSSCDGWWSSGCDSSCKSFCLVYAPLLTNRPFQVTVAHLATAVAGAMLAMPLRVGSDVPAAQPAPAQLAQVA